MKTEQLLNAQQIHRLIDMALEERKKAYAPYSGFLVGAALLAKDGTVFTGCNIENSSFGATNCAERTAFFKAVSEGKREFCAIAVAGAPKGETASEYTYPCGICRQVMLEFCEPDFSVICIRSKEDWQMLTLAELVPFGFSLDR